MSLAPMDGVTPGTDALAERFLGSLRALGVPATASAGLRSEDFAGLVDRLNREMKLRGEACFVSLCPQTQVPAAPTPLTVVGASPRLAVWGLNPKLGGGIQAEKQAAGFRWDEYARFYCTGGPGGFLRHAIDSTYYYNIGTLMAKLSAGGGAVRLKDFFPQDAALPGPCKRLGAFRQVASGFGVMFLEYVPFHSQRTPTCAASAPVLAPYHQALLSAMAETLAPGSCILGNGKAVSSLLNGLLGPFRPLNHRTPWREGSWRGHRVVLLYDFIGRAGGTANSDADLQELAQALRP